MCPNFPSAHSSPGTRAASRNEASAPELLRGLLGKSLANSRAASAPVPQDNMLDCLIIGAGPAGLTAAVYLARYRRTARVVDSGESRALMIPLSHNYAGFKGISGPDLLGRLREQACSYGTSIDTCRVSDLSYSYEDESFTARADGQSFNARFILLATGLVDVAPEVRGEARGDVIRYCPVCDGYEATDRRVGVLGSLKDAGEKALFLRTYTKDVAVFSQGGEAPCEMRYELTRAGIKIFSVDGPVEIVRGDRVILNTVGDKRQELDFLYPALGCRPRSELATSLGAAHDRVGCLKVDDHQQTTVDRLYSAGDVVTDLHQLSVAIGHAAIAATAIHNRLPFNPR